MKPETHRTGTTEDELLATLRRVFSGESPGVRLGIGDDAAVVDTRPGELVLTADILVEGVHFTRSTISPRDLGAKAVVVNVSDVAAMGASPRFALVSLAVPPDADAAWVVELEGGVRTACDEYALAMVGGDLSSGAVAVVSVAVVGEVARGRFVSRSGARAGDRVVVTGSLGASAGGLALARAPAAQSRRALGSTWGRSLMEAHVRPVARVGEGQTLAGAGATAMMDVSDGLAIDLSRLCRASGVGARVRLGDVPVAAELGELRSVLDVDPLELALSGGEDYELLATMPPGSVAEVASLLDERFGVRLTDIGEITRSPGLVAADPDGEERPLEAKGWDHLARR
ncbi:MAG TPA: thiamine-phosphate kinase [Actinomycetota bacterium]